MSVLLLIRNKSCIFAKSFTYMKQKILERIGYSERIERMFGRGFIVALTGQRRVGKSCVMRRICNHVAENNHVIYIDKEKTSFDAIVNYRDLEAYVKEHIVEDKDNFLFIDEVQEISEFEKAILSIQSDESCQIMITGSNAKMLSGELATRLRGRYVSYRIRGLCYEEFLTFHDLQDDDAALKSYLQYGGLPQLRNLGLDNVDLIDDYLDNVYNTIILRDVIERENIRNIPLLRTLLKFISDNIGKQFSARSIVNFLKSQNTDTSAKVILSYLEYLSNAYIIDRVNRFDIHGKKLFELGDKFYFEDLGIRNHIIGGNRSFDIEKVMENVVYNHLARLGYTIYVGQMFKTEIDFVAEKADNTVYVQVTYLLASPETIEREFGNLRLIKDSHPKYVVSMDRMYGQTNIDGIKHVHLRDFLKMTVL